MLRKVANISIALLLLTATAGFTISEHYCGNTLKTISPKTASVDCCGESSDCCHTETITLKVDDYYPGTIDNVTTNKENVEINRILDLHSYVAGAYNILADFTEFPKKIPDVSTVLSRLQSFLL